MTTKARQSAVEFFYENAAYRYDPATETPEDGRRRTAEEYARAEEWLVEQPGFQVEWKPDADADEPNCWGCIVTVGGENSSLWGIDFGDGAEPWGQDYARVVVAELSLELMPD